MSGLIANPEKIWLVVEPMDLRRGIEGLSQWCQQSLGSRRRRVLRLFFATGPGFGSRYCFGMATGFGCVAGVCIKAILCGRRRMNPAGPSRPRNGNG